MNDNDIPVRIVVGVGADGRWWAVGDSGSTDDDMVDLIRGSAPEEVSEFYYVEAYVPAPVVRVVTGALVPYAQPEVVS
jgi:hypothetical protein